MPRKISSGIAGLPEYSNLEFGSSTISSALPGADLVLAATGTGAVTTSDIVIVTGGNTSTNSVTGDVVVSGGAGIAGDLYVGGTINTGGSTGINSTVIGSSTPNTGNFTSLTTTGVFNVAEAADVIITKTGATGTVAHDFTESRCWLHTSISANFTANFTNVPTTDNRQIEFSLYLTQGTTAYYASAVQINGVAQTINWAGFGAPTPTANKTEILVFTLTRVGGTWTVLGSLTSAGQVLDGSTAILAAPSALFIKQATGTTTNGLYWIRPQGAPAAQQVYCIMNDAIGDGGGWMCAFNIIAGNNTGVPGGAADWNNTSFWDTPDGTFNTSSDMTANFKNNVYGYFKISKINIVLHNVSNTSFRGWGAYLLSNNYKYQTLYQLCSSVAFDNKVASSGRYYGTGGNPSGAVTNPLRNQTTFGDLFVDDINSSANLVFRAAGQWGSDGGAANNRVRIATDRGTGNTSYGHTYAGIGGIHNHSGWKQDFAMAPISPYCDQPNTYGSNTDGVNATSYAGFSFPYGSTCTNSSSGGGIYNVAYGVFVK